MSHCYTQVPNALIDVWMSELSPAEFKVAMLVARRTFGWRRDWAVIKQREFMAAMGLSNKGVINALQSLVGRVVERCKTADGDFAYRLRPDALAVNSVHNDSELSSPPLRTQFTTTVNSVHNDSELSSQHIKKEKESKKERDSSLRDDAPPATTQRASKENVSDETVEPELHAQDTAPQSSDDDGTAPVEPSQTASKSKSKRASTSYVHPSTGVSTLDIESAYRAAVESWEPRPVLNFAETRSTAKRIAQAGYKPDEVAAQYDRMKQDSYWEGKHLSLASVARQLGAANHVSGNSAHKVSAGVEPVHPSRKLKQL